MTTLLDSQALVAFLGGEPAAPEVASLLQTGDAATTAVTLAEVVDVVIRNAAVSEREARSTLALLVRTSVRVVNVDEGHAWTAGELRASHYHHRRRPISIPDCVLLAAAGESDFVATADSALLAVVRDEGIGVIPLLDSAGRRPR